MKIFKTPSFRVSESVRVAGDPVHDCLWAISRFGCTSTTALPPDSASPWQARVQARRVHHKEGLRSLRLEEAIAFPHGNLASRLPELRCSFRRPAGRGGGAVRVPPVEAAVHSRGARRRDRRRAPCAAAGQASSTSEGRLMPMLRAPAR